MIDTIGLYESIFLSLPLLTSGIDKYSADLYSNTLNSLSVENGYSINLPPILFNVFSVSCLIYLKLSSLHSSP